MFENARAHSRFSLIHSKIKVFPLLYFLTLDSGIIYFNRRAVFGKSPIKRALAISTNSHSLF